MRDQGHVRSKALVLAYAVCETGRREVIGLDLGEVESEAFWTELLRDLRRRGLQGVRLCVSDQHDGLRDAIARVLASPWQAGTMRGAKLEPALTRLVDHARLMVLASPVDANEDP